MVDNRTVGPIGLSGGINFKSGDISGTAAKTSDDRASQGTEYFLQEGEEANNADGSFVDRSMQLRASLNSLALLNVVSMLQNQKRNVLFEEDEDFSETLKHKKVHKIEDNDENEENDER